MLLTKEEKKAAIGWLKLSVIAVIIISVVVVALKIFLFPVAILNTATNSTKGVINKTLDSSNVIHKYEWFHDVNAAVESRLGQIRAHSVVLVNETDKKERSRLNMELAAMQQICRDLTVQYNANSEKVNVSIFKGSSLPTALNINNCEVK